MNVTDEPDKPFGSPLVYSTFPPYTLYIHRKRKLSSQSLYHCIHELAT